MKRILCSAFIIAIAISLLLIVPTQVSAAICGTCGDNVHGT